MAFPFLFCFFFFFFFGSTYFNFCFENRTLFDQKIGILEVGDDLRRFVLRKKTQRYGSTRLKKNIVVDRSIGIQLGHRNVSFKINIRIFIWSKEKK